MGNKKSSEKSRPSTYLTEDDFEYLQEITNFDRSELLEWHNSFMSECPNGYLTKKTLQKTFEKIYPNGKPQKICSALFNTFDMDQDGKIDFYEYMNAIAHLSSQDICKKLHLTFRIYDADHNGFVNRKELEKMMVAILELNGVNNNISTTTTIGETTIIRMAKAKVVNIFKRFNKDLDECIDETEFVTTCLGDEYLISLFTEYRI